MESKDVECTHCGSYDVDKKKSHNLCRNSYVCNCCGETFATYDRAYKNKIGRQVGFSPKKKINGAKQKKLWDIMQSMNFSSPPYDDEQELGWG